MPIPAGDVAVPQIVVELERSNANPKPSRGEAPQLKLSEGGAEHLTEVFRRALGSSHA
jgi:hypothetical protein